VIVGSGWGWWLDDRSTVAEARVIGGEPLALVGSARDGLREWANAIDPQRPVLDLQDGQPVPTVGQLRRAFEASSPIVLGTRPERVIRSIGLTVQPYYLEAAPLSRRPTDAPMLLEAAISEYLARPVWLADLGERAGPLRAYRWRGLGEIRHAARHLAAVLAEGNLTRAAARLGITRQAMSRYLDRRTGGDHQPPRSPGR
jgi:hypothetical protein